MVWSIVSGEKLIDSFSRTFLDSSVNGCKRVQSQSIFVRTSPHTHEWIRTIVWNFTQGYKKFLSYSFEWKVRFLY